MQTMLGSPSKKDLQALVSSNMIEKCPFMELPTPLQVLT